MLSPVASVIFVCCSLGCNVTKMAGIARQVMSAVGPKGIMDTNGQSLDALQKDSETLQNINDQFVPLMKSIRIFFFWQQEKTHLAHTNDYVGAMPPRPWIRTGTDWKRLWMKPQQRPSWMAPIDLGWPVASLCDHTPLMNHKA